MDSSKKRRRGPRVPLSCPVTVRQRSGAWVGEAEDVGARGCRIALQHPLTPGSLVELRFERGEAEPPLDVVGQVAWARNRPPFDAGIAFVGAPHEGSGAQTRSWIDGLLAAHLRRVLGSWSTATVELSRLSQVVVELGIPPTEALDRGEATLVQLTRNAVPLSSVCSSPEMLEVLIRLLERGALSVCRPTPDPVGWRHALAMLAGSGRTVSRPTGTGVAPSPPRHA